jgi:hypothetical protein
MKKVISLILVFILIFSIDSYSLDKPQKTPKNRKVESINKKSSRYGLKHLNKKALKRMQKLRIKNHKQKKSNNMRKR